jgi:hypothetical protein
MWAESQQMHLWCAQRSVGLLAALNGEQWMSDEQCQPLLLTSVIASGNGGDGSGGEFPSRLVVTDQCLRHRRCMPLWRGCVVHARRSSDGARKK